VLLFNLDLLAADPGFFLRLLATMAVALVVAITGHEASHAFIATLQGDFTARSQNRLSLNPLRHLDPAGTAMIVFVGFGWGRPVPVNPYWLKSGPRLGMALVALAGPASNLLMAAAAATPFRLGMLAWHPPFSYMPANRLTPEWIGADLLAMIVYFNIILAVFNLIPLAPLDGFKVALGALPREMARSFARLEPYGPGILMAVLLVSYMGILGFGLWDILGPAVRAISLLVLGRPI